ncbi:unnamed protein product [Anisakis simplex]|uniref:Amino acid transporter n=1 Tax=Anisakis simplex TaxID=6269 RepID=A0A0M3JSA4_ANISI|nr:unnamed protein product [Anisakis simplex]
MIQSRSETGSTQNGLNDRPSQQIEDENLPSSPQTSPSNESLIDRSLLEWQDEASAMSARYRWHNHIERLLTFCSYTCDPASIYIVPRLYGKHGAAFTYCLLVAYLFVGLPVTYLEMALGQYTSTSPHRLFSRMVPATSGATLEGWVDGAEYLVNPSRRSKSFADASLYADAVTCVLLTLRLGSGGIHHLASHNSFHNNIANDAVIVVLTNIFFSILSVFGTFFYLGYIANSVYYWRTMDRHKRLLFAIESGVLDTFPIAEVASKIKKPLPGFMHATFFFVALTLSTLQSLHGVMLLSIFLCAYFTIVKHGYLIIIYFRRYISYSLAYVVLIEIISVVYVYRLRRFLTNIRTMVGGSIRIKAYWWTNWFIFTPVILSISILVQIFGWKPTMSTLYKPAVSIDIFGWLLTFTIIGFIPGVLIYSVIKAYRSNTPIKSIIRSDPKWGPASTEDRLNAKKSEKAIRV